MNRKKLHKVQVVIGLDCDHLHIKKKYHQYTSVTNINGFQSEGHKLREFLKNCKSEDKVQVISDGSSKGAVSPTQKCCKPQ